MSYSEPTNALVLENSLPMSDTEGKAQSKYFEFIVTSHATTNVNDSIGITIPYEINISDIAIDSGMTQLPKTSVKVALSKMEGNTETTVVRPTLISNLNSSKIREGSSKVYGTNDVHKNGSETITTKYRLRAWIDKDYMIENADTKTYQYKFRVNVNAYADRKYNSGIKITNFEAISDNISDVSYTNTQGISTVSMPFADSTVSYRVELSNFEDEDIALVAIGNVPENMEILYTNYTLEEFIPGASTKEFEITLKYLEGEYDANVIDYELKLDFIFSKSYVGYNFYDVLVENSVSDNGPSEFVEGANGIDFLSGASDGNGKGVYLLSDTKDDTYPIYYYRGNVKTNNVVFGQYCWKVVRTTETGGTKLIYNGIPVNGECNNTGFDSQIAKGIKFNTNYRRVESIGYSYENNHILGFSSNVSIGTIFANDVGYENGKYVLKDKIVISEEIINNGYQALDNYHYTCLDTADVGCSSIYYVYMIRDGGFYYVPLVGGETIEDLLDVQLTNSSNEIHSDVRVVVDDWYADNMTPYTQYLEDTIFCNDRSIYSKGGWDRNGDMDSKITFASLARVSILGKPSLECVNKSDRFTVSEANGNGNLTYPIGLLSMDEAVLAGHAWFSDSSDSYLYNDGKIWWTMSPALLSGSLSYIGVAYSILDNLQTGYIANSAGGVRPSISLKSSITIGDGFGTADSPFIITN